MCSLTPSDKQRACRDLCYGPKVPVGSPWLLLLHRLFTTSTAAALRRCTLWTYSKQCWFVLVLPATIESIDGSLCLWVKYSIEDDDDRFELFQEDPFWESGSSVDVEKHWMIFAGQWRCSSLLWVDAYMCCGTTAIPTAVYRILRTRERKSITADRPFEKNYTEYHARGEEIICSLASTVMPIDSIEQ